MPELWDQIIFILFISMTVLMGVVLWERTLRDKWHTWRKR